MPEYIEKLEKIAADLDQLQSQAHDLRYEKLAFMIALAIQEADRTLEEEEADAPLAPVS